MKQTLRFGTILFIICVISAGLLSFVYGLTKERISNQKKAEEEQVLKQVLANAARIEEKTSAGLAYYVGFDKDNKQIGRAFIANARGYSGDIAICAGMDNEGNITSVKILSHTETPGLGSKVADANFLDRFKNRKAQDLGKQDAITGATISSTAVIEAIKEKIAELPKE